METRKIQQVSNGTFTVSLPREWADAVGITTGTVVDLHTHIDGLLVVQPPGSDSHAVETVTLAVDDQRPANLEQTLRAAYLAGPDEIALTSESGFTAEQQHAVRSAVRNLVGVTITDESETHMRARNVLDANEVSVRQSVRQLQFVALSMHREATAALLGLESPAAVVSRDDRADRLYQMTDRYFTRALARLDEVDALGETRQQLFYLHAVARAVERVADHAERIAAVAADIDDQLPDSIADDIDAIAHDARDAVETAVDAVFAGGSIPAARDVLETSERVQSDLDSLERRLFEEGDADYRLVRVLDSLDRTVEHANTIAEAGVRRALCSGDDADGTDDATGTDSERQSSAT
ncbi:PhoU domain-containing protein [Haloferax namakaokahaiae]|uniref:PhoU domain-containing protein n=1 Tax=Haloferax namakaokahaiae TaxID=1748331 RepID=A0ABD5ZFY7_9EURY